MTGVTAARATRAVARGRLPGIGHAGVMLAGGPLRFLRSLQRQADIVRVDLGPVSTLCLTCPDLIFEMLTDRSDRFGKGIFYDKVRPLAGNGIVLAQGDEHRRQYAMVKPAFHKRLLDGYTEVMREAVLDRIAFWQDGRRLDVDKEMHAITMRVLARTMFGAGMPPEVASQLTEMLPDVLQSIMVRTIDPADVVRRLPLPMNRRFDRAHHDLRTAISRAMLDRRDGGDGTDMLSVLLASRDPDTGEPMTTEEIHDQIVAVTMAGSETAATGLTWMFHELSAHPEVADRIAAEIDEVLGDRPCTLADTVALPYCRRVLHEVMRLRQPIMVISRRAMTGTVIGGVRVPAGTELFYSPYAVHRDPMHFDDPLRFDPQRWLRTPAVALPRGAYTPFGAGPRHCVGEQFAWAMMTVVAVEVLRRWRLRLVPGTRIREMPWATINPSSMPMIPSASHP